MLPGTPPTLGPRLSDAQTPATSLQRRRLQLAAQACYDPEAAVSVFEKLGEAEKKMGGGYIPRFLRTHPLSSDRVEKIKQVRGDLRGS